MPDEHTLVEGSLAVLHAQMAKRLLHLITVDPDPKLFEVARKFLQDNGVNEDIARKLLDKLAEGGTTPEAFLDDLPSFEDEDEQLYKGADGAEPAASAG